MNSRKAQNDSKKNRMIVASRPKKNANATLKHRSHQARTRELNVRTTAGRIIVSGCRFNNCPATQIKTKSPNTTAESMMVEKLRCVTDCRAA